MQDAESLSRPAEFSEFKLWLANFKNKITLAHFNYKLITINKNGGLTNDWVVDVWEICSPDEPRNGRLGIIYNGPR